MRLAIILVLSLFVLLTPPNWERVLPSVMKYDTVKGQCTAFSINSKEGLWLTAKHCLDDDKDAIEVSDAETDLAVVIGPKAPRLRLGKQPRIGDQVVTVGYPARTGGPLFFFGHVSQTEQVMLASHSTASTLFHEGGGPGGSGGPVMSLDKRVVSVVQGGFEFPSVIMRGVTYQRLKAFAQKHWEQ